MKNKKKARTSSLSISHKYNNIMETEICETELNVVFK